MYPVLSLYQVCTEYMYGKQRMYPALCLCQVCSEYTYGKQRMFPVLYIKCAANIRRASSEYSKPASVLSEVK